jgi:hypothetical protein
VQPEPAEDAHLVNDGLRRADRTFAHFPSPGTRVKLIRMRSEILTDATTATRREDPPRVTYAVMATEDGDIETGVVLLDGRPLGRLSWRARPHPHRRRADGSFDDSAWHAEAVGWLPHQGRPWDTRVTSSAPTRRRAAEDLLRAYRNRG